MDIFRGQVASLNKPENVKEGIVKGKFNKLVDEICLLNQGFVKDPSISVEEKMKEVSKETGCNLKIENFYFLKAGV